ncbi:MAG: error-prone DNA polymerase [Nitratireductor sp.]
MTTRYFESAVTSNFSFLRGASHPEELVVTASRLGLGGIALCDRNSLAGVVRAHMAAKEAGLRYQPGCRLVFEDATPDCLVYPRDLTGWNSLCTLLTTGNRRARKGECLLRLDDLLHAGPGLSVTLAPASLLFGGEDERQQFLQLVASLREVFTRHLRLAVSNTHTMTSSREIATRASLAQSAGILPIITNDVLYHRPSRRQLQDVVSAIREHVTLARAGTLLEANAERHLKEPEEMARLFEHFPGSQDWIREGERLFATLGFSLDELRYQYPDESPSNGLSQHEELARLAYEGAANRYPLGIPQRVLTQIDHELKLIAELQYAPYFLTVYDIVRFARSQGILCQGRGSAANSTVCYCIGITDVDPALSDLLFERFISPERREPPDIDVDFEHERREEVIQYIYAKYGREHAGLAASVITYRARSAAREIGKVFGLSQDAIGALSGSVWGHSSANLGEREARESGLDIADPLVARVLELANEINGFPRHLSQHVGGFVITRDRLDAVIPVMNTAMEGRTQVEWDKDDLESLGILKIDILALGMLTCLRKAFDLLEHHYDLPMTLATMEKEDKRTYAMIQRADTIGVFQIESRAQMSMLPRLKPREFYDLVIEVAIVRPGPIQGDMVHPYLRRRQGKEKVSFPSAELEAVLGRTLGVPLFQEQAMKIAIVAAGFTPGEADKLRRAMATFRRVGTIHSFQAKMVQGMTARGYDPDFAERCFRQIEGFGEYGFPESHAASFALLVYASCWLKCHYPDVFAAAILNSQPMGFYSSAQLVRDAREHGVTVLPVDINISHYDTLLEAGSARGKLHPRHREMAGDITGNLALRLGFRQIKGIGESDAARLVAARGKGYATVRDLWLRSGLSRGIVERLADADAFRSIGLDRRAALWEARALEGAATKSAMPLFDIPEIGPESDPENDHVIAPDPLNEPQTLLPEMTAGEHVIEDYRFLSLSLKGHPVAFVRDDLRREGMIANAGLEAMRNGSFVHLAGLVMVRQRPGSAKGVVFMTLEDESGIANVIVWPKVMEQYRATIMGARFVAISGIVQKADGVTHVVVRQISDRTAMLAALCETGEDTLSGHNDREIGGLANADEVRRPVQELRNRKAPHSRIGRLLKDAPELRHDFERLAKAGQAGKQKQEQKPDPVGSRALLKVLPGGRNFH